MITPPIIQKGDSIGITAPAGKIDNNIIEQACLRIESLGYKAIVAKHVNKNHFNFSSSDENRLSDLQEMINNKDIQAIICARGGYGTARIIDKIDFAPLLENPKWIVGFSDITVLHSALQRIGMASIHGPMCKSFLNYTPSGADVDILFAMMEGEKPNYLINPYPFNRSGIAQGTLFGGNLSILQSLRGTKFDIEPKGKILFIEDLSEYLYHLDRMMYNLKLGGVLENISGLVVGQFTEMRDNELPFGQSIEEIIYNSVAEYNYPVAFNFPSGHIETNYPLLLGADVTLSVNSKEASLKF